MTYDAPRTYRELIEPQYAPIAAALLEAAEPSRTDDALELGAGTGLLTEMVAPRVGSLVATDVSEPMLEIARERVPRARFAILDYTQPFPYEDASFDLVLSCLTFAQKLRGTVDEMARVLRPRARVALAQWGLSYREAELLNASRRALGMPAFPSPTPGRNAERLARAGFRVERTDVSFAPEYASVGDYIEYRRGFGRPQTSTAAEHDRFLAEVARRAERLARSDGRFINRWNITILVATAPAGARR
jgi:SAM-dependent methyltransferase